MPDAEIHAEVKEADKNERYAELDEAGDDGVVVVGGKLNVTVHVLDSAVAAPVVESDDGRPVQQEGQEPWHSDFDLGHVLGLFLGVLYAERHEQETVNTDEDNGGHRLGARQEIHQQPYFTEHVAERPCEL